MFLDDLSNSYSQTDHHSTRFFPPKFKENIIQKAASMLLEHMILQKKFYYQNLNNNTNAFDEYQHKNHCKRTNKCNSWLAKYPKETHLRFDRLPIFINSSSCATSSNMNAETEIFSSPLMLIHKKRHSSDYFLSKMQNCIHPPYSQNHFYAFDQFNMLKLQRILQENNQSNLKRKYSETFEEEGEYYSPDVFYDQTPPSKKQTPSPLRTADHISIDKYHEDRISPEVSDEKPESQMILSRLEKILNLCEELRTLATDVDNHLNEKPMYPLENIEDLPIDKTDSEQIIIDIYKELEIPQAIQESTEINVVASLSSYHPTKDTASVHSNENKSEEIMQTESFKTKSTLQTTMRKPEEICECFLKSILDKEKCPLNLDEQEYLDQLTKAYLLGREQVLREQNEENNKFQAFLNETLPDEFEEATTAILGTDNNNNNNQSITPIDSSSIIISNSIQNCHEHTSTECGNITVKHQIFISEPIGTKSTNVLPGIGIKYTEQLANCGFLTVRRLLGFYLMIKNDQNFVHWLMNKPQLSTYSAWLCTKALRAWCQIHL